MRTLLDRFRNRNEAPATAPEPAPYQPSIAVRTFGDFTMALRPGSADEYVLNDSFDADIFFPAIPEYQVRDGDVIVDVGAHIGTFSVLAASRTPSGAVHAIEASQETYDLLRINAALNQATNLHSHHLALSDRAGQVTLHHDVGNWGHSIVKALSSRSETTRADTLEHFLQAHAIEHCALMKFNCEGAEFPILLTTPDAVLDRIERMLILYHCDLWSENTADDLIEKLRRCRYKVRLLNLEERRGWIVAIREGEQGAGG